MGISQGIDKMAGVLASYTRQLNLMVNISRTILE